MALPVTVSGLDARGHPFTQSATTVEVSARGVRLRGLRHLRSPGDPVEVQYKDRSATYRIAWIGQNGTCWEGMAGCEGLERAESLFAEHLPESEQPVPAPVATLGDADEPAPAAAHSAADRREGERRRFPRVACAGVARIWESGSEHDIRGRINEISLGGCYVEMMSPLRSGTALRLELSVSARTMRLEGVVRLSQPNYGMGVEFTRVAPAEAEKLYRLIAELKGEAPAADAPEPAPSAGISGAGGSDKDLRDALLRWFGARDTLTRQEFLQIMEELKREARECASVN